MQKEPQLTTSIESELSRQFREQMTEIAASFKTLNVYTDGLEEKVDGLLRKQEEEFFKVYKAHFAQIREEVRKLQGLVAEQQRKINEYENEGALSIMIKKSNNLERELIHLYQKLQAKEKANQELRLKLRLAEQQQAKLEKTMKDQIRDKRLIRIGEIEAVSEFADRGNTQISVQPTEPADGGMLFATEIEGVKRTRPTKETTMMGSPPMEYNVRSFASEKDLGSQKKHVQALKKRFESEVARLKKKNQQLLSTNVKAVTLHNEMSLFFISCVEECRKNVCVRNRIPYCELDDFKREDKLAVLMAVLENEQLVALIHQRLFSREATNPSVFEQVRNKSLYEDTTKRTRLERSDRAVGELQRQSSPVQLPLITHARTRRNNGSLKSPKLLLKRGLLNFEPY